MIGAKSKGAGMDMIRITGDSSLHGAEYQIIPDYINITIPYNIAPLNFILRDTLLPFTVHRSPFTVLSSPASTRM